MVNIIELFEGFKNEINYDGGWVTAKISPLLNIDAIWIILAFAIGMAYLIKRRGEYGFIMWLFFAWVIFVFLKYIGL